MNKNALIFGVTGQDGSYLSSFLLDKDYDVVGVTRRSSTDTTERLDGIKEHKNFTLVEGDITDPSSVNQIVDECQPDELYNLAAQSHVGTSFKQPSLTFQVDAVGPLNILEAVRIISPDTKVYQASTSEMFGNNYSEIDPAWVTYSPGSVAGLHAKQRKMGKFQNEDTPFSPRSPYAVAKMAAHNLCFTYRESYDIFAACGILFNHESEKRGENFVTRKITKWIGEFKAWHFPLFEQGDTGKMLEALNIQETNSDRLYNSSFDRTGFPKLGLGNLKAKRDWGHAEDYVRGMWLMLQQDRPDDFVLSTGKTHSIGDFLAVAFAHIGIEFWEDYVYQDPEFYRPADVQHLLGDASKAEAVLGWKPEIDFTTLVHRMVDYDVEKAETEKAQKKGIPIYG